MLDTHIKPAADYSFSAPPMTDPPTETSSDRDRDAKITKAVSHLVPYGPDASLILFTVLTYASPHKPSLSLDQCGQLLDESGKLYDLLVRARLEKPHNYQTVIEAVESFVATRSAPPPSPPSPDPGQPAPDAEADAVDGVTDASPALPPQVAEVLIRVRESLQEIVDPAWKFESWSPDTPASPEIRSWLSTLDIPLLNNEPNLLLHQLGSFQNDPGMSQRLAKVFLVSYATFLVNTSGSGKTRHLLEGLCRDWGFYFCSTTGVDKFGSCDLMNCIRRRLVATAGFTPHLPETGFGAQLAKNREIASTCINQVLLARFIVFQAFLAAIVNAGRRKITEDDKRRWIYLQVAPHILGSSADVFDEVAQALHASGMSAVTCQEAIAAMHHAQRATIQRYSRVKPQKLEFFCVLDEAQFAATHLAHAFRSFKNDKIARSVLREILVALCLLLSPLFGVSVAGTGVDSKVVEDALSSVVHKNKENEWSTVTGAFEKGSSDLHEAYIRRYIPTSILNTSAGARLISRIGDWLEGRFRFTASFLANLLKSDFTNPHQFLDDWVEYHTRYRPTDAVDLTSPEAVTKEFTTTPLYEQLDFDRFRANGMRGMDSLLTTALYESLLRYDISTTVEGRDHAFIQTGFARYRSEAKESKTARISEPLILLAASHWVDDEGSGETLWQFVTRNIGRSTTGSNGFENYTALAFAYLFARETPLKDVFDFPGNEVPKWAQQSARLVALHRHPESGRISVNNVNLLDRAVPCAHLGRSEDKTGTLAWLQHRNLSPFCFPEKTIGPDILFVLQLQDKKLIWVAIQNKYLGKPPENNVLYHSMRSTVPEKYWIQAANGKQNGHVMFPTLVEDTRAALQALPNAQFTGKAVPWATILTAEGEEPQKPEAQKRKGTTTAETVSRNAKLVWALRDSRAGKLTATYPVLRAVIIAPRTGVEKLDTALKATEGKTAYWNHHDPGNHPVCALNTQSLLAKSQTDTQFHFVERLQEESVSIPPETEFSVPVDPDTDESSSDSEIEAKGPEDPREPPLKRLKVDSEPRPSGFYGGGGEIARLKFKKNKAPSVTGAGVGGGNAIAGPSGLSREQKHGMSTPGLRLSSPFGGSTSSYASPPPSTPGTARWSVGAATPPPPHRFSPYPDSSARSPASTDPREHPNQRAGRRRRGRGRGRGRGREYE
ncbi:hypothetical protein C8R46DRAFT_1193701 [Mycena filopes]|nr:hypothetical protein C8R46DRAFT_1193701 [Mycena filopes]